MITKFLFAFCVVALTACSPHVASTSAAPKPNAPALYVNEDFTLWHTEGAMAPTVHMEMSPSAVSAQANGKVSVGFDAAGTLTLMREIPTPGDANVKITGTAQIQNTAVIYQLWQDGKLLIEKGNGGAIDVSSGIDTAGMVKHVLIMRAAGKGKLSIQDMHISITKRP